MNKKTFISEIRKGLSGLPNDDIERSLDYYSEMIDECMEDGKSEEEAVANMGSVEEIVSQILKDTPLSKLVRAKVKTKRGLRAWEIVLLALGCPIWLSLGLAAICIVFSVYVVFWSVIFSLYITELSLAVSVFVCLFGAVSLALLGHTAQSVLALGAGFILVGIVILLFFGCIAVTRGVWWLGKQPFCGLKRVFAGKKVEV